MSKKKDKKAQKKQRKRLLIRAQSQYADLPEYTLNPPDLPQGVVPQGATMAMDSSPIGNFGADFFWGTGFIGYPKLAELAQIDEYRAVAETTAKEMTREWIEFKSIGDDADNSQQIKEIETYFGKLNVRQIFRQAIETEHLFGRSQILLKIKGHDGEKLKNPLVIDPRTIEQGSLKALVNIEPMWTSPALANTHDPTEPDFYKPKQWYIMGQTVHDDRLFTLVSRPVPDMLKPAYNFGGVSMSQLMMPYVNRWLRTVNSVSDLVNSFSLSGIKTSMQDILSGGCDDVNLQARADLYNQYRDNRGLMLLDKEEEEFFQFNTPLSTLDALLAQAQEQMAAPSHTPLVKLLGITPSGLNASSEGEIAVYYDWIKSLQENLLREPLTKLLKIVQLHLFGEINDNITFEFKPLAQMSELDQTTIRKTECDIDVAYLQNGVISDVEVRTKLAANAQSGFNGIDVDDVPENNDDTTFSGSLNDEPPAQDSDNNWDESQHPRDENGQFQSGGTGGQGNHETAQQTEQSDHAENKPPPIPADIQGFLGTEYHAKGQEAVNKLLTEQNGHIKGAFHREGFGDIDLIWGNDDVGLKHIIKRRAEQGIDTDDFLSDLNEVITKGNLERSESTGNFEIWHNKKMAIIAPEFKGNRLMFLLTAFKSRKQTTNKK
ncbi:anti-CBASS protein Acb1 family protein [Wielerella bovis]|uniref:anti-CBASS protein Acb1 family protein n=1 Tax=Wielerella bovis TaxID=2917790 RepID=UPI0020188EE9|nr:anti-CBASS Acb1 family protein [Wielerella bovis]ULJ60785.1 DUF1073 domain-containing protein [Wielerella bovis]